MKVTLLSCKYPTTSSNFIAIINSEIQPNPTYRQKIHLNPTNPQNTQLKPSSHQILGRVMVSFLVMAVSCWWPLPSWWHAWESYRKRMSRKMPPLTACNLTGSLTDWEVCLTYWEVILTGKSCWLGSRLIDWEVIMLTGKSWFIVSDGCFSFLFPISNRLLDQNAGVHGSCHNQIHSIDEVCHNQFIFLP